MDPRTRVVLTGGIIVVLVFGLYIFTDWFSKATGYVLGEDQKAAFANCLKEHGAVLYEGAECAACEKQRKILGEGAYAIIPRVMCGEDLCKGLRSVPAWEIEGKLSYGTKTYAELDDLSICDVIVSS